MRLVGLVGAALAVVAPWLGWLLVVDGHVVPGWGLGVGLLVVALVLLWIPRPAVDKTPGARLAVRRRVRAVGTALAVISVGLAAGADALYEAKYQVLSPGASDGCRVVVRETSALKLGTGDAYVVRGLGLGQRTATWVADDGYRPVRAGTYDLALGPDGGTLTVRGTASDPVMPGTHPIDCG
ncbi:hypothetical protein [Promicromonospora sp. NPDC057488]|uniref:hypothetical protein n=1 Tax=Promicromonospora sp. NPDC057488 TaxID=3346147 RepID=UPI00366D8379